MVVTKGHGMKPIECNRNILGALVSFDVRNVRAIEFAKSLTYPLPPVHLTIGYTDKSRWKTGKS